MKRTGTKRWYVWVGLVVLLFLAACAADSDALQDNTPTSAEVTNVPASMPAEDSTSTEGVAENNPQSDYQDEAPAETAAPQDNLSALGFENGDPNLKASDPNTFSPAAGKPQLVELFAFW